MFLLTLIASYLVMNILIYIIEKYFRFEEKFSGALKTNSVSFPSSISLSVLRYSRLDKCSVGPVGEGAHVKHGVAPGVDSQINAQNPNEVQHEAGFHLRNRHCDQYTVQVKLKNQAYLQVLKTLKSNEFRLYT